MHSEYNLTLSCVRLSITMSTYFLLYKPCFDKDFVSFLITSFIYILSQWINILDVIEHNKNVSKIEVLGVILGLILISAIILLLALNTNNLFSEISSYAILICGAVFCVIDFMSLAKVLKKRVNENNLKKENLNK